MPCAEPGRREERDAGRSSRACSTAFASGSPAPSPVAIALASVQPVPWVSSVSIRWPCQLRRIVARDQRVGERVAGIMAALGSTAHRSATQVAAAAPATARPRRRSASSSGRFGVTTVAIAHQPLEGRDRRLVGEHRAAGRDHHRIEHDRHAPSCSSRSATACAVSGRADHPDLHRIDADVARPPRRSAPAPSRPAPASPPARRACSAR